MSSSPVKENSSPVKENSQAADNYTDFDQLAKDNYSFELKDLKTQLEKQTIEIKRKDKENANLQKQILLLQKDAQESHKEIQLVKSRNSHLQKALIDTKLEFEKYEEEDQTSKLKDKVKSLSEEVLSWTGKYEGTKLELEKSLKYINAMKQDQTSKDLLLHEYREKENAFKKDSDDWHSTNTVLTKLVEELRSDLKSVRSDLNKSEFNCLTVQQENTKYKTQVADLEDEVDRQKDEIKKLQGVIAIRNETNAMLRDQVDDVHNSLHTLTIDEWNAVKKIEQDNASLNTRCKDLVKSVDLHIQLQKRAEEESSRTKTQFAELNTQFQSLQMELESYRNINGGDTSALKQAQKEIKQLRKEKKELQSKLDGFNGIAPPPAAPAAPPTSSSIAVFDDEARDNDRKKRELAENSVQELRSRIFILLEQIDALFQLNLNWEENKLVMQAEIAALHESNRLLRTKLEGNASNGNAASQLPTGVESTMERYLFDLTCAFSSGKKVLQSGPKGHNFKLIDGEFKVISSLDGFLNIRFVSKSDNNNDLDEYSASFANDILNNLQIPKFIKLVQERREVKVLELFTDKLAAVLNFHMNMAQELFNQIGESRMSIAKTLAQTTVAREHVIKANDFATKEKTAKQKALIKFIREQMRISDISSIVKALEDNLKAQMLKMDQDSNLMEAHNDTSMSKAVVSQLQILSEDIKLANVPSGVAIAPHGALELRLQNSQICDETIHGIVSLLEGKLKENSDDDTSSTQSNNIIPEHLMEGSTSASLSHLDLFHQQRLASIKNIIGGDNYFKKVILLNLRGNQLTDVACKMLTSLVERSPELRMLDLRDNFISVTGKGILFDSVRKNKTVLYVSQKQNGDMIEGHREIVGSRPSTHKSIKAGNADESVGGSKFDFERLVGVAKFPLRIDIRNNESESRIIEDKLKNTFFGHNRSLDKPLNMTTATEGIVNKVSGDGAISNLVVNSNSETTTSFKANKVALGYSIGHTGSSRPVNDDDDSDDDDMSGGGNVKGGAKGSTLKKGIPSILDIIKSNPINNDAGPSNDVGKMLDEKIRHIEETAAHNSTNPASFAANSPSKIHYSAMKKPPSPPKSLSNTHNRSSMDTLLASTLPNNYGSNSAFFDDSMSIDRLEAVNGLELTYPPPMPSSGKYSVNMGLSRPPGAASTSIVREKLTKAKQRDKGATLMSSTATAALMRSTSQAGNLNNKGTGGALSSAKSSSNLLEGLNRLNPSMLF